MSMMAKPENLDPRTLEDMEGCGGCERRPTRWYICEFHEGYEAALGDHGNGYNEALKDMNP